MDAPIVHLALDVPAGSGEPTPDPARDAGSAAQAASVAEVIGFPPSEAPEAACAAAPERILAELDGLAARLASGAETASRLRGRVEHLLEATAETGEELLRQRERLAAAEEARRQDRETVAQLEEELARRAHAVAELKTRLGDLLRAFDAVG
jgi:hypothetical protein